MRGKGDGAAVSEWRRESGVESQTGKTDVMTHSLIFRSVSSQSGENPDSVQDWSLFPYFQGRVGEV